MKKTAVFLLIIIFLAVFFLKFNYKKPSHKDINTPVLISKPAPTTTPLLLPDLYVNVNLIKRKDTGEPVRLKGVTSMVFAKYKFEKESFFNKLKTVLSWKINLLGLYVNYQNLNGNYKNLDSVVDWAKHNKVYIYLMPAINVNDKKNSYQEQMSQFEPLMINLTKRYQTENHIFYGLWAEPRNISWVAWKNIVKKSIKKLRENNSNSIFLMTGIQYGRIFPEDLQIGEKNIVADFHDYPWSDMESAKKDNFALPYGILWQNTKNYFPVLVGEFGGVYAKDFGSEADLRHIKTVIEEVNKYNLNYTAYTIDDEGELGLYDWLSGQPTNKGRLIIDDLTKYPPSQF